MKVNQAEHEKGNLSGDWEIGVDESVGFQEVKRKKQCPSHELI